MAVVFSAPMARQPKVAHEQPVSIWGVDGSQKKVAGLKVIVHEPSTAKTEGSDLVKWRVSRLRRRTP